MANEEIDREAFVLAADRLHLPVSQVTRLRSAGHRVDQQAAFSPDTNQVQSFICEVDQLFFAG